MTRLENLGLNIKKYREAKNWSQEFFAEKVDLSREYVSRIEKGHKYVSLKKLFLFSDVLEVKISDIVNFD